MTRYVGITGFMSRAEVDAALDALPDGLTLMCGVLVSEKTLRGERNKWWRRYPHVEHAYRVFSPDKRCLNLIHYCATTPPDARIIERLTAIGGPHLHGFQFNGAWPDGHAFLEGRRRPLHVVLQARPKQYDQDAMRGFMAKLEPEHRHVLLDASGGRGEPLDPKTAKVEVRDFRLQEGYWINLGVAGGLCADTLPDVLCPLRGYDVSIDAEGRLRDGDEGGVLNIAKVRDYLRVAGEVML